MSATIPVREHHRIDEARLAAWMDAHVPGYHGPLQVDQFQGGQSNPTYRLRTPEAAYVLRRKPPGKLLIDHEGVGFMLAENLIELQQCELMIDWCAGVLDAGSQATTESSMAKVAVSEALFRIADRCVQVMGGLGVSRDTIVEQVFRETRAFRIYDGPTEVHKWSLARKIKRDAIPRTS